ncbi:MAG TPA: class II glutamine amidotransferase [bacterium]|nr:class II glutamine amidotransferase [bacterium]
MKRVKHTAWAAAGILLCIGVMLMDPMISAPTFPTSPTPTTAITDIRDSRENCRLLGIVTSNPPDTDAIATILKGFRTPSYPQDSGWSLAAYSNIETGGKLGIPYQPMIIRTQTPILNDLHTWEIVANLVTRLEPGVVLGHLRNASSGCSEIADPHPFQREYNGRFYLMIHNGGIWGKDLDYLTKYLITGDDYPQNCPGSPIDSEYLFIYLMQLIQENGGDPWRALYDWASTLTDTVTNDWNALNIVLSDGEIIWALRLSYRSDRFSLNYSTLPNQKGYAVSTEALGPGWSPLPNFSLAEFRAGFLPFIVDIPRPFLNDFDAPYTIANPNPLDFSKPEQVQ